MNRRTFIHTSVASLGALALGARLASGKLGIQGNSQPGTEAGQLEGQTAGTGRLREYSLVAEPTAFEIPTYGVFQKWLYNGQFPGPEIRAKEGERLRLTVNNKLPEGTTVHWHGIPLHNSMDGVPDITQPAIASGGTFVYEFDAAPSGSFWYHSHFGLQPERGLIGPLIVEEKKAHVEYDREYTLALTDFLPYSPVHLGRGPRGICGPGARDIGGGMEEMVTPPYLVLLINGRPPEAPAVFDVKKGERVRLRVINPSGATIYRFAIGGHPMSVTHTDGRPVEPLQVDALYLGPGERYDVLVEAKNSGAWPIAASPDNHLPPARAVLRYIDSNETRPPEGALPEGSKGGRVLQLGDLRGLDLPDMRKPTHTFKFELSGGTMRPGGIMSGGGVMGSVGNTNAPGVMTQEWVINGQAYPKSDPMVIQQGDSVRIRLDNKGDMPHPMHLHGHTFRVGNVMKDTAMVWTDTKPVELDFVANNAGVWLFHCHNIYHMEGGMMRLVRYA